MTRRFDSKKDLWLSAVLWATVLAMVVAAWNVLAAPLAAWEQVLAVSASVATAVLIVWLWSGTYYEVGDGRLSIYAGPFRQRIELDSITAVTPTRAAWSSPALSLDRLRIDYCDGKWVMVSPEQRDAFIAALGRTR